MKCDIKIMASPKRYAYVLNTCKVLGLDIEKDVFFDDRPTGGDAAYTSEKTWSLPFDSDDITHRCVIQDDVLCCKDFRQALDSIVAARENAVFSLFCPSLKLKEFAEKDGIPQFVKITKGGMYGPAIVMPRSEISNVYAWGRELSGGKRILHDDVLFGEYALAHGMSIYTTVPSLIQHICPDRSLLGYNDKRKISKVFDMDACQYDWINAIDRKSLPLKNSTLFYEKG